MFSIFSPGLLGSDIFVDGPHYIMPGMDPSSSYVKEINNLRQDIKKHETKLNDTVRKYEALVNNLHKKHAHSIQEADQNTKNIAARHVAELQEGNKIIGVQTKLIEELKKKIVVLENTSIENARIIALLRIDVTESAETILSHINTIHSLTSTYEDQIQYLNSHIKDLDQECERNAIQLQNLDEDNQTLNENVNENKRIIQMLNEKSSVDVVEEQNLVRDNKILIELINGNKTIIEGLRERSKSNAQQIQDFRNKIENCNTKLNVQNRKVHELITKKIKLSRDIYKMFETARNTARNLIESRTSYNISPTKRLFTSQIPADGSEGVYRVIDNFFKDVDKIIEYLENEEGITKDLLSEVQSLKLEKNNLRVKIDDITTQKASMIDAMSTQIDHLTNMNKNLIVKNNDIQKEVTALISKNTSLNEVLQRHNERFTNR